MKIINKFIFTILLIVFSLIGHTVLAKNSLTKTEQDVIDKKAEYIKALEEDSKAKAALAKASAEKSKNDAAEFEKAQSLVDAAKGKDKKPTAEELAAAEEKKAQKDAERIAKELAKWPTEGDNMEGDTLKFRANAYPFYRIKKDGGASPSIDLTKQYCAPKNSKARVSVDEDGYVHMDFKRVGDPALAISSKSNKCLIPGSDGTGTLEVSDSDEYVIKRSQLEDFGFFRRGFTYGGLVIPFKYYTGGERRVSGSATVAPYLGWRGLDINGLQFTPTVTNTTTTDEMGMETSTQETKTAFSMAAGLMLSSPKNKAFSAGILVGRDRLSTRDRMADPTAGKTWVSVFAGIEFNMGK